MKKTVKTGAWLTNNYTTIEQLSKMSQEELVACLHPYDLDGHIEGWTLVGIAEVSITLDAPDNMIANKIKVDGKIYYAATDVMAVTDALGDLAKSNIEAIKTLVN